MFKGLREIRGVWMLRAYFTEDEKARAPGFRWFTVGGGE
jgi:hypothetical protein